MTLALSVDLGSLAWSLAYDAGIGFLPLGSGAIDSLTLGLNSLRLAIAATTPPAALADRGLALDRIRVAEGAVTLVPEPRTWALWMAGLALLGLGAARRRRRA